MNIYKKKQKYYFILLICIVIKNVLNNTFLRTNLTTYDFLNIK